MKKYGIDTTKLIEYQLVYDSSTPAPWDIWDGPKYCGGGHDYCIGAGENWLANMDHRYGRNYDLRVSHDDQECKNIDCLICSFSNEVTREQQANAVFITKAKNEIIPWAFQEIKNLRWHYGEALELLSQIREAYEEQFPTEDITYDWNNMTDEEINEILNKKENKLASLINKIDKQD